MKIVLTGGGTAGHVTPNIALLPGLKALGFDEIHYIGSIDGIEKTLMAQYPDVIYHEIRTGKLRRYRSVKNLSDPIKVIGGYNESRGLLRKIKPDIVFSKGGYVSVPVVWAARRYHIPVVSHESDITPGLANKLAKSAATKICVNFPDTLKDIPEPLGIYTGTPIRAALFEGDGEKARADLGFDEKPVVLVMGGSLGSRAINDAVRGDITHILEKYNVIHLCGKNNIDESLEGLQGYRQFEFVSEQLPDYMALAEIIVSRAGANAIHEFLALHKPMLLIPLPLSASRGDQILNAKSFEKRGIAMVLEEENMSPEALVNALAELREKSPELIHKMQNDSISNGTEKVLEVIMDTVKNSSK